MTTIVLGSQWGEYVLKNVSSSVVCFAGNSLVQGGQRLVNSSGSSVLLPDGSREFIHACLGKLCDILSSEADIWARATGGRKCGHSELFLSLFILRPSLTSRHASAVVANGVSYDLFVHSFTVVNAITNN